MNNKSMQRLPRNVWIVTITSLLTDVSSEMLTNLIPFFLARENSTFSCTTPENKKSRRNAATLQ
jgi:hypothetical protein